MAGLPDFAAVDALRPPGRVTVRHARVFDRDEPPRALSTSELRDRLAERSRGARDFVLVDVLSPDSFADRHIEGAINLPRQMIDEATARKLLGDTDREVILYCAHYG
jgi:hypothetical protein